MSLFDSISKKYKAAQEEKRYAAAHPKQYLEELKTQRKAIETSRKIQSDIKSEKEKLRELNKPKALRAVQEYLASQKAKRVTAKIGVSDKPTGTFSEKQVEQRNVFTEGLRDGPFTKR